MFLVQPGGFGWTADLNLYVCIFPGSLYRSLHVTAGLWEAPWGFGQLNPLAEDPLPVVVGGVLGGLWGVGGALGPMLLAMA